MNNFLILWYNKGMRVKVISVGKLKENYLKDGISEYNKRLGRFCHVDVIELVDEKIPDKASVIERQQILTKESNRILAKVGERDFVVVLAIYGKQLSSESFSQLLQEKMLAGYSTLTFIIGGSLGLADVVKERANYQMSFGQMTLPHQLMRLVLIEQIYRAFMIAEGSPYHK